MGLAGLRNASSDMGYGCKGRGSRKKDCEKSHDQCKNTLPQWT
jgi:hypothetical protein